MTRVYWDTMLFIYLLEAHPAFGPRVQAVHQALTQQGAKLCTSVFTVGEILTMPRKTDDQKKIDLLMDYFEFSGNIQVVPFTIRTAQRYAEIRAKERVLSADAIHLASASEVQADMFMTNDRKLQRLRIDGIKLVADMDGRIV